MAKAKKLARLGLVEFLEKEQQMAEQTSTSAATEEMPTCPRCGSSSTTAVSNARHCNQCGLDYGLERDPIGKRARAPKVGWPANAAQKAQEH